MLDTVVRGALVVTPSQVEKLDVGMRGGVFAALAAPGELVGRELVDATDMVLLPGGVDPHVHIATQARDLMTLDDFATATIPAAIGGTTSIVEFAIPRAGESTAEAIARRHREASDRAVVDYAFHAVVTGGEFDRSLGELAALREAGVGTVKMFTAYLDTVGLTIGQTHRVLRECARQQMLPLVHCETESLIKEGIAEMVVSGNLGPSGHARSRSTLAEADAIRTISDLALDAGSRLYIVHISSAEGAAEVARRKAAGQAVLGETCPQYLFLDDSVYARPDGELWICSPPIRPPADVEGLWREISASTIDVIATDHNCFDREQKAEHRGDFRDVPNGLPGIELRMPLLVDAVQGGRLSWSQVARLAAESPARAMGLMPRKGAVAIGFDADFALVNPAGKTDLGRSHMATDYTPFVGVVARGSIEQTWLRGTCLVRGGEFIGPPGGGRHLTPTTFAG